MSLGEPGLAAAPAAAGGYVSEAQRSRAERQRARALALREARLALGSTNDSENSAKLKAQSACAKSLVDSGGGFLLEVEAAAAAAPRLAAPPPAPLLQPTRCLDCDAPLQASYLLEHFDYAVCDDCRDTEGEHALVTRTEAKAEYLLRDCDLDSRPPPLRCVRRTNPHRAAGAPMRLYLRAQLEQRARHVWGGEEGLASERARRAAKAESARAARYGRELRALRLQVRGSTRAAAAAGHEHAWGPERHDAAADTYSRVCDTCGHTQTYEKM